MSWDLLLTVFLHVNYLCLMMRKNQINLSALNTADMLKYIKVIFQGPVVFLLRGRGGVVEVGRFWLCRENVL